MAKADSRYARYIGWRLYNNSGNFAGNVIALKDYHEQLCFYTTEGKYGRYWNCIQLDIGCIHLLEEEL